MYVLFTHNYAIIIAYCFANTCWRALDLSRGDWKGLDSESSRPSLDGGISSDDLDQLNEPG